MRDHSVSVDRTSVPARIDFARVFNTAVALIDRQIEDGNGARVAIRTDDAEISYSALAEQVNRCGNALRDVGLAKGDRVLMVVKDDPVFFYLFFGAIKAGIVPVPLNTLLRSADYQYMIEDSGCAALVYSPEFASEVTQAVGSAARKPDRLLTTEAVTQAIKDASSALAPAPAAPDDDCFWLYSSGSTGRPKGAVHRQRDIVVTCVHYAEPVLGIGPEDVCFSAAKLFFAYGLGNAMTFPLWAGATAVLSDARPSPDMTFDIIERHRPTLYFGVPTLYAAQLHALEAGKRDLSSLRLCVSAGEALPPDLLRRWKETTGLDILDGIGSTEMLHIFMSNRTGDIRPGTTGRILPGYEARIIGEDGTPVPNGEPGVLHVKGQSAAAYYWNQPERTADTMRDGWMVTGDTYAEDSDGYFVFSGRSDDMLKVGGIWCSPVEIEARLIEHPAVLEAAIVGRADADGLIKPEAFVIPTEAGQAGDALAAQLLEHCKTGLAPYKYPRWFNFVDELPKTATGKIQRFKLRQR